MKVLVVSEDLLFARLAAKKLNNWGFDAETESNGATAFKRLKKEPFRIAITDWDVPGMSGLELTLNIRKLKRSRYSYIIVSTNQYSKDVLVAALEAGADDFLGRPLNPIEFRLKMANVKRLLDLEDELRDGAGTDSMTGLVNLASFRQFFRVVLAETRRMNEKGSLMYVSVNDYKQTLEEHGFGPAETLMVEISRALNQVIRNSDIVARISDDEFCMLLQNTYWDRCRPVADKAHERIDNMALFLEDFELRPKVTIGTVNYPVEDLSSDETLKISDRIPYAP